MNASNSVSAAVHYWLARGYRVDCAFPSEYLLLIETGAGCGKVRIYDDGTVWHSDGGEYRLVKETDDE